MSKRPPSNPRRYHQENDRKFLIMVIFTLVVVGGGLIALIFGPVALLTALPFLLGGTLLILVPWGLLTAVQKWRDQMEQAERDVLGLTNTPEKTIIEDDEQTTYSGS
ncbi:MAG: hypothetical protein GY796_01620 [Chloroflexi bacterium]|nr:hypothetical protein [Chloroflexota bacterium]